jgi:hypothetical protein
VYDSCALIGFEIFVTVIVLPLAEQFARGHEIAVFGSTTKPFTVTWNEPMFEFASDGGLSFLTVTDVPTGTSTFGGLFRYVGAVANWMLYVFCGPAATLDCASAVSAAAIKAQHKLLKNRLVTFMMTPR